MSSNVRANSYNCLPKGSKTIDNINVEIHTFKSEFINQHYIVEILHLENDVYIFQFYLKTHRLSDYRFNLLLDSTSKNCLKVDNNNKHVFFLFNTLTLLALDIKRKNNLASFGFMGAPTPNEKKSKKNKENINPDGTVKNTKRYRVYSLYIKRYFSPEKFDHISYHESSCYLLRNLENTQLSKETADEMLNNIIKTKISN